MDILVIGGDGLLGTLTEPVSGSTAEGVRSK